MHLFLDANTYLDFFRLSDDNLEQLEKLSDRVGTGETILYVTRQVRSEFVRNRESSIDEALDTVRKAPKLPNQFAHIYEAIDGYEDVRSALKEAEQKLRKLREETAQAVADGSLHADVLINDLFARGRAVEMTAEILDAAKLRSSLGNPPGKPGSLGDAVNWESLLDEVPDGEDLVLVTNDGDFKSKLDPSRLNQFLAQEWAERKQSQIDLHGSLRSALETHYPEIKLVPEPDPEQELAVQQLVNANNFSETHRAIRRLSRFADLEPQQVASIVEAADGNSQIRGIMEDDDVFVFYDNLVRQHGAMLESHLFDRLNEQLQEAKGHRSDPA